MCLDWETVGKVNAQCVNLRSLSNDELRTLMSSIRQSILVAKDDVALLDSKLVPVFAIVKEFCRRLSVGDVVVTATATDQAFVKDGLDFISIDNGMATYHNEWMAQGEHIVWGMVHYDEQILAGIYLHKGCAVEMATGEGKTLAATLPVCLNALTGKGVHIMTANDYLSKRDYELTRPLYAFFGLLSGCIENEDTHSSRRKPLYQADITFGATSSFVFDYLFDNLSMSIEDYVQREPNYAIIDEVDSILIDEANTPHIVSGGQSYDVSKIYKQNKPIIEELLGQKELFSFNLLDKSADFTLQGEKWLEEKLCRKDLFKYTRQYQIPDFSHMSYEAKEEIMANLSLRNCLHQLLRAYTVYTKDVDYVVTDKIIIIDENTGRTKPTCRWEHGLHTAVEVKEKVRPQVDFEGMGTITLKNYFKLYQKVSGMSGTIDSVAEEFKEVYNLDSVAIPTHNRLIREDRPFRIFATEKEKWQAIVEEISQLNAEGHPVLVSCANVRKTGYLCTLLEEKGLQYNRLDAKTLKDEARTISQAGQCRSITVSTSIAGRGTDIKLSKEAKRAKGLAVIGTELFESSRIDKQLIGRSGRQGDPGSSQFFLSYEDDILSYLPEKPQVQLELTDSQAEHPFIKAQRLSEEKHYKDRMSSMRKDDIIAPFRSKYYQERRNYLWCHDAVRNVMESLLSQEETKVLRKKEEEFHDKVKLQCIKQTSNNKKKQEIHIPFSDNTKMFVLKFDIDKTLNSLEYFSEEFDRQILLQCYDKEWRTFVAYVLESLDEHELADLSERSAETSQRSRKEAKNRWLNSVISIGESLDGDHPQPVAPTKISTLSLPPKIAPDAPCPCGSGKTFGECHGSNIRQIKHRRR